MNCRGTCNKTDYILARGYMQQGEVTLYRSCMYSWREHSSTYNLLQNCYSSELPSLLATHLRAIEQLSACSNSCCMLLHAWPILKVSSESQILVILFPLSRNFVACGFWPQCNSTLLHVASGHSSTLSLATCNLTL